MFWKTFAAVAAIMVFAVAWAVYLAEAHGEVDLAFEVVSGAAVICAFGVVILVMINIMAGAD